MKARSFACRAGDAALDAAAGVFFAVSVVSLVAWLAPWWLYDRAEQRANARWRAHRVDEHDEHDEPEA